MSEESEASQPETEEQEATPVAAVETTEAAEAAPAAGPGLSDAEIQEGKLFAILSYLGILCLIPIFMRKNEFALYHARQGLLLAIGGFVVSAASAACPLIAFASR